MVEVMQLEFVCPVHGTYLLGTPIFDQINLGPGEKELPDGKIVWGVDTSEMWCPYQTSGPDGQLVSNCQLQWDIRRK